MTKHLRKTFALLGGIVGAVAAVVQLATAPSALRTASIVVLLAATLFLAVAAVVPEVARLWRSRQALPTDIDLDNLTAAYVIAEATPTDIAWIAQHEATVYSTNDAIPEALLREWYAANPKGFSIIKTADGRRVGHLDILPLRPRTCESFIAGDIFEREIRGDSLYGIDERERITCLYVESIALCLPKPLSNTAAISTIMASLPTIIARVADPSRIESIYAIAASRAGDRFMRRLGFEVLRPAERRKDGHDFFFASWSTVAERAQGLNLLRPSAPENGSGVRDRYAAA